MATVSHGAEDYDDDNIESKIVKREHKQPTYFQVIQIREHQDRGLEYNIDDEYNTMAPRLEHQVSDTSDDDDNTCSSPPAAAATELRQRSVSASFDSSGRVGVLQTEAAVFSCCSQSVPDRIQAMERGKWRVRRRHVASSALSSSSSSSWDVPSLYSTSKQRTFELWNATQQCLGWSQRKCWKLPPTTSLPILVLIDMFAVSLVVPLLFQYYKAAGVNSANQRELLSSLFSSAQIVGGLLMGVLADAKLLRRKTILFLSFGGSAVSYAMIVHGGLFTLILSRLIVGFVKQTMTIATTILTRHTTKENRTKHMGRLSASSTVAWIVGPSTGALLFKYVDKRAPAIIACALFCVNLVLAAILLEDDEDDHEEGDDTGNDESPSHNSASSGVEEVRSKNADSAQVSPSATPSRDASKKKAGASSKAQSTPTKKCSSILSNLRSCFSSKALGAAVITKLIATFVTRATNYSQLGSFYEDMYGLEPHHRGYISSYQQFLEFIVQSALVGPVLAMSGGERQTTCFFTSLLAFTVFLESWQSLPLFLFAVCPLISLCFSLTNLSLQSLVTHVAPTRSIFSVLAALDVLQNAVSVSVPFYRTFLFRYLAPVVEKAAPGEDGAEHHAAMMQGDPDPVLWIYSSALHWIIASFAIWYLLLSHESWWIQAAATSQQESEEAALIKKRKGK